MATRKSSKLYGKDAVLVIHGGAGSISKERLSDGKERQCREKLRASLKAGYRVISNGGTSVDAVIAAVKVLEDSSLFNAGKGSCLTRQGKVEMDAALMDGETLEVGAVTGINNVKNPINAARAVMDLSPHTMLMGAGANSFARKMARRAGLKIVPPDYFVTQRSWRALETYLDRERQATAGEEMSGLTTGASQGEGALELIDSDKYGTVGAVGVDQRCTLAAATSTGGIIGKAPGRVGDSPIIGAGTFADNQSCAVSGTGHGEHFVRLAIAHEISAMIRYQEVSVKEATDTAIFKTLKRTGGQGGVIVLAPTGDYACSFNTQGMFRGVVDRNGRTKIAIF